VKRQEKYLREKERERENESGTGRREREREKRERERETVSVYTEAKWLKMRSEREREREREGEREILEWASSVSWSMGLFFVEGERSGGGEERKFYLKERVVCLCCFCFLILFSVFVGLICLFVFSF